MTPILWEDEPDHRGRIPDSARHVHRLPKAPTKRGTEHGTRGRIPSDTHRQVARQTPVECRCGYRGPLEDVRWWKLMARWIGECPECHHSPTFTVPLSEFFDR